MWLGPVCDVDTRTDAGVSADGPALPKNDNMLPHRRVGDAWYRKR